MVPAAARRWLEGNELETLPEEVGGCEALQEVYLDNNRLRALPLCLAGLSSMRRL
jgi:Leucine-rich repeat (LRR) protein